jgi:N-acetylmuramoyl-L-alanine amidase
MGKFFTTEPMPIIDLPADRWHFTDKMLNPRIIILHATAGVDSRDHLTTTSKNLVSCHRLIMKDGTQYKIVQDNRIAHHAGFSRIGNDIDLNPIAFGIELENLNNGRDPYPTNQINVCARLIVEKWGGWGFTPVLPHSIVDTMGKTDPAGFPWHLLWHACNAYLQQSYRLQV